jgi:hypothetical protein
MRLRVEAKEAAREAAEDAAHNPGTRILKVQLQKLLDDDAALAAEVRRLWEEAKAAGPRRSRRRSRRAARGLWRSGAM